MAEINWTRESEIWLEDIYRYIAADDPEAAERTVSLIYEKAQPLRSHQRLGYRYEPERSRDSSEDIFSDLTSNQAGPLHFDGFGR